MKISYNWLKDYVKTDLDVHKIGEILTGTGLEVEGIETSGSMNNNLEGILVGRVITLEKHPNADKLQIATVDIGTEAHLQIICGAPNIKQEQKVPVATIGTVLTAPNGETLKITKAKLRGVESMGMICSEAELGISDNHDGIWVLEPSIKAGTPLTELIDMPEADCMIEIGLTPNRSDAMSHLGVARDLNAALKVLKHPSEFISPNSEAFDKMNVSGECPIQTEIRNPELAVRYSGLYLENLKIQPSPEWLQQRLKTIGLNPINNVVDITNYILHDLGQPLHAFDADKISGGKIIVQTLEKETKFTTLDGVERKLNGNELMICDENGGMCMAGIYGGLDSGVTENTKRIFLESAYFDPVSVRKSSKFHGLNTDSSFRFERGCDPNMTIEALKKATLLLIEYADARIVGGITDFYPKPIENQQTVLRYYRMHQLLGERIHHEQVKDILKSLDIEIISESNESLELSIPPYRADVLREVDIVEEVLRIYGYNRIKTPEKIAYSLVDNQERSAQRIENAAAQTLISDGFYEAMNNSVGKEEHYKLFQLKKDNGVMLLNPLSSDLAWMRQSMLPGLLENTVYNLKHKTAKIKLFEFGKIYERTTQGFQEFYRLGIVISGQKSHGNWTTQSAKSDFFTLKGLIFQIFNRLGIQQIHETALSDARFSDGIRLIINQKELGVMGIVRNDILKKMDIGQEVFAAELDWDYIVKLSSGNQIDFQNPSKFPAVKRDLALLIDQKIKYSELYDSVQKLNINLLKSVQLFDFYEGDKLPAGKKSYAMSFVLQDTEKTLTDKEIDHIMQKIIQNFKKKFEAELRD
ncbi:MAG: phenylalanine--tRNA ligase subunit beta [Weeksellaceae bacterium]